MRFRFVLRGCALLLVAGLMTLTARHGETSTAVAQPPPRRGAPPPVAPSLGTPNVVRQGFPAAAARTPGPGHAAPRWPFARVAPGRSAQ